MLLKGLMYFVWIVLVLSILFGLVAFFRKKNRDSKSNNPMAFVAFVAFVALIIFYWPQTVLQAPDQTHIEQIVSVNDPNVTYAFDAQGIKEVLSQYQCRKSLQVSFPYPVEDPMIELIGTVNQQPLHIVIGERVNLRYETTDSTFVYLIMDSEGQLMEQLQPYLNPQAS